MSIKSILQALSEDANAQLEQAYHILGAKPGPGTDLLIEPAQPICGKWNVSGLTEAGKRFVGKFWSTQPINSNRELDRLKKEATDWQLKYRVEYPIQSMED